MPFSLLDLPNEILSNVLSLTANADLDNFSLTSTTIYNNDALIKHRERKKLYATITCGSRPKNAEELRAEGSAYIHDDAQDKEYMTTWSHPALMLRDLIADDLLCYPATLCICHINRDHTTMGNLVLYDDNDKDDRARALKSFPQTIGSLVKASPYLDSMGTIASDILNQGKVDATLGFLLTLLPNLITLKLEDTRYWDEYRSGSTKDIIKNVLKVRYSPTAISHIVSPPLSKLKCLVLKRGEALETYAPLIHLPSISNISVAHVDCMYNHYNDMLKCPGFHIKVKKPPSSWVGDFELRRLDTYFRETKVVRQFQCQYYSAGMFSADGKYLISGIVQRLLDCATHTLLTFDVGGDVHNPKLALAGGHYIGSLKSFRVLKTIRIGGTMLIEPLEKEQEIHNGTTRVKKLGRPRRLIDVLPSSTVRIAFTSERLMYAGRGVDEDVAIAMLQGLPEGKSEFLPNLVNVEFEFNPRKDVMVDGKLWRQCRRAGVEITDQKHVLNHRPKPKKRKRRSG